MPPYGEWLASHMDEMLALRGEAVKPLFFAANMVEEANKFTVTYETTKENFEEYERRHADKMRNIFKETYRASISAFAFERTLING